MPKMQRPKSPEEFIEGANQPEEPVRVQEESYPWEDPKVREDVIKSVNLRLDEPTILKLKWLSEKTQIPQQVLMRQALIPFLEEKIAKVIHTNT